MKLYKLISIYCLFEFIIENILKFKLVVFIKLILIVLNIKKKYQINAFLKWVS